LLLIIGWNEVAAVEKLVLQGTKAAINFRLRKEHTGNQLHINCKELISLRLRNKHQTKVFVMSGINYPLTNAL
jgi:hypothetical protein